MFVFSEKCLKKSYKNLDISIRDLQNSQQNTHTKGATSW